MEAVKSRLYNSNYKLTSDLVIARNAIEMVKLIVLHANTYDKNTIQQYMFSQTITDPSILSMEFSGFARMKVKIYRLNYLDEFEEYYTPKFTFYSDYDYPSNYVCSWKTSILL